MKQNYWWILFLGILIGINIGLLIVNLTLLLP
jgi:uncharacterized membrane-anchored protein YhcB (DUF1043 family)